QCTLSLADRMEAFEKAVLADTLKRHEGRASAVAKELQMPRKTLYDRLARHDLRPANYRPKS
ncbi:MAG: helix-turn-helix domain-containing protein, partial [Pseudomonadota bacterium]